MAFLASKGAFMANATPSTNLNYSVNSAFIDYSFFHNKVLTQVVHTVTDDIEADPCALIGQFSAKEISTDAENLWELFIVLLRQIFHYLKCTFSKDYNERFLAASRKITLFLLRSLHPEPSLRDNTVFLRERLEGFDLLKKQMLAINKLAIFVQERDEELDTIANGAVVSTMARQFSENFARRRQDLLQTVPARESKIDDIREKLSELKDCQSRYFALKQSLEEASPKGVQDNIKYFWGKFGGKTQKYVHYDTAKKNLADCALEIREMLCNPSSGPIDHLNDEEMTVLEEMIAAYESEESTCHRTVEKMRSELASLDQLFEEAGEVSSLGMDSSAAVRMSCGIKSSKQQKMIKDMRHYAHPHLAKIWEKLLGKFENEEVVKNWTVQNRDGSFCIELTRPIYVWIPTPACKGGAIFMLGKENNKIKGRFVLDPSMEKLEDDHKKQVQKVIDKSNAKRADENQAVRDKNPSKTEEELMEQIQQPLDTPPKLKGMIFSSGLESHVHFFGMDWEVDVVHMLHAGYPGDLDKTANIIVSAGNWLRWAGGIEKTPIIEEMWCKNGIALEFDVEKYPFLNHPSITSDNFYKYFLLEKRSE